MTTTIIKITAVFAAQVAAIVAEGKTPWLIINEDYAVGAYAGRNEARAAKAAENLAGKIVKASEVAVVAPIGEEIVGDVHAYVCPHCGGSLENGVGGHGDEVNGTPRYNDKYEYECLGCGGEFGPAITKKAKAAPIKSVQHTNASTTERPCKLVWHIADEMKGAKRKQVIAEAERRGVAYYTARTQYQLWSQCQKEMAEREAASGKK